MKSQDKTFLSPKKREKILKKVTWQKPVNRNQPVYNPVKENLKAGFRFVKLFWAIILLAIIFFLIIKYGEQWGIKLDW